MAEMNLTVTRAAASPTWDEVRLKPESFTPSEHNHDARYYTESETDTLLAAKQGTISDLAEMRSKLAGIEAEANKYVLPTAGESVLGGVKVGAYLDMDSGGKLSACRGDFELIEKCIVGYTLTLAQPSDWAASYTSYYTNTGTAKEPVYTAVTGASAPTWTANTYYSKSGASTYIHSVSFNTDTEGNAYDFIDVVLMGKVMALSGRTMKEVAFYANGSDAYHTIGRVQTAMDATTYTQHLAARATVNGGRIFSGGVQYGNYEYVCTNRHGFVVNSMMGIQGDAICSVMISYPFLAGDELSIYAVKRQV